MLPSNHRAEILEREFQPLRTIDEGSHPSRVLARVISGLRRLGSSSGRPSWTILLLVPSTRLMISWASCITVISFGFPRLTGSEKSVFEQSNDPFDQIRDIAEAASLLALSVDA